MNWGLAFSQAMFLSIHLNADKPIVAQHQTATKSEKDEKKSTVVDKGQRSCTQILRLQERERNHVRKC